MLIKTLLNRCHKLKSFVYEKVHYEDMNHECCIVAEVLPRENSKPRCPYCRCRCSTYDHKQHARLFEFIPIWGFKFYLRYRPRRVSCAKHGVHVEHMPWVTGNHSLCTVYQHFLARWARRLSWKETASSFRTSWDKVFNSVKVFVEYGLKHRDLTGITAIGVDEVHYGKRQQYVTLVYQIENQCKRLLYMAPKRNVKSLLGFFRMIGKDGCGQLKFICSDMWKPYLKVIKKKAPQALHILDRFHVVSNLNEALNEIRAGEARRMKQDGYEDVLKNTKYCFMKNERNLTDKQKTRLEDVMQYDLKSVDAYLLKESFQGVWNYTSAWWAGRYLDLWCDEAEQSELKPIKRFARSVRKHHQGILNYFRAEKVYSSGIVEGLNRKVNLTTRKAYGFRTYDSLQIALFHTMGKLPEPKSTHTFL